MRRLSILSIILFSVLFAFADTYTIYVNNQTGWSTFDLYAWGDSEVFGKWPGATSAPSTTVGGVTYSLYSFSVADGAKSMELNLIFHNNVGEGLSGDRRQLIKLTTARDYCLKVTDSGITELSVPSVPAQPTLTVDNTSPISNNNRVIYELNLYDFTAAGTLSAAQARLSELRKLGIDIIWLMPIFPRGQQGKIGTLGSPYAPKSYTQVNSDHGSLQDLKNFVNKAHELGMAVWLDWVPNHTGLDHEWVTSHSDYYVWSGGSIQHPNDYGDVYQLNFQSSAMCSAMIDAMKYWVNEADIDGFRWDYVSSPKIGLSFFQQAIPAIQNNSRNKHVEMLGEADFTASGNSYLYNAGFEYDYAWGYADGLKSVGTGTSVNNARNAAQNLLNTLNSNYSYMSRMAYLTNHDDIGNNFSSNYMSVLGSNVAPMTVMYFTFFGMPLIYVGQEIGYSGILNYFNRNSINWNSINYPIYNTIRSLVALKHTLPALADGAAAYRASTKLLTTNNSSVLAFEKSKAGNTVIVVINLSNSTESVTLSGVTEGDYTCLLNSSTIATGCYTSEASISASSPIAIEAKGYRVYSNTTQQKNYHIYVNNQTGWSEFDLYEWGTPHEIYGAWPGAKTAPTKTIDGITYLDYDYSLPESTSTMELNLIFHNNVGEGKTGDYRQLITLTEPKDYYLTVTHTNITTAEENIEAEKLSNIQYPISNIKYLKDGHLLILTPDGKTYNVLGQMIK